MSDNTIRTLLDNVVTTGRAPDHTAVRAAITKYSSVRERREIEKKVRHAALRIVNALDAGLPDQAAEHAADIGEACAAHTAAGAGADLDPRALAAEVPHADSVAAMSRVPGRSKTAAEPLRALLRDAAHGGLRARDLDALSLKSMSAEERTRWRAEVVGEASQIRKHFAAGNQAEARALADEAAERLGSDLTEPEHVDPAEGITDPRELAAMLPRDRARG